MNLDKKDDFAELRQGEFIFDDEKYNHYTDPITIGKEKNSYRDTIVITIKKSN